jgi:hypothetical protein
MSMRSPGHASKAAQGWSMHPPPQQLARITGVLFILTFITSIAGLLLYDPVLNSTDFITGAGSDTRVELGALCEVFLAITNIGTVVALFPSSSAKTRPSRSATSPLASSSPPSSSSASSACSRS